MSAIQYVDCSCAREFLREIEEINPRFRDSRWIFRGHANADWELLPKALRSDTVFFDKFIRKYKSRFSDISVLEDHEREELARSGVAEENFDKFVKIVVGLEAERKAVAAFCNLADRVGLRIPLDEGSFWSEVPSPDESIRHRLGRFRLREFQGQIRFALARHHGIPTRLLDWTFKPLTAAFFSTQLAKDRGLNIAVWALDTGILRGDCLRIIQHRRTQIGFLNAQDGVFVVDPIASERYFKHNRWMSFEEVVSSNFSNQCMCKVTLPISEVENLKELLAKKDVDRPHLMPSYDYVAQEFLSNRQDWIDLIEG